MSVPAAAAVAQPAWTKCRVCRVKLSKEKPGDDFDRGACADCIENRPKDVARLHVSAHLRPAPPVTPPPKTPRPFTEADHALSRAMHRFTPAADLLRVLNDRLVADLGDAAVPYTMDMLETAARVLDPARPSEDWAGQRRQLAQARRSGLLNEFTDQVVDDFATVFRLSPAQATHLRDVIATAKRAP